MVEVAGVEPASKKRGVEVHPQAWSVWRGLCGEDGQTRSRTRLLVSGCVRRRSAVLFRSSLRQAEATRWKV